MNCITYILMFHFCRNMTLNGPPDDPVILVSWYSEHTKIPFISPIPYHSGEIFSHRIICNLLIKLTSRLIQFLTLLKEILLRGNQRSLFVFSGSSWTHVIQSSDSWILSVREDHFLLQIVYKNLDPLIQWPWRFTSDIDSENAISKQFSRIVFPSNTCNCQ